MSAGGAGIDAVRERLRACRPPLTIDTLEPLGSGDFCDAWLLNGTRVVRIPKHAEAAEALRRESCVLRAIRPYLTVPVPAPELLACGGDVSLHDFLTGEPLLPETWHGRTESGRAALAGAVGRFLAELHRLDIDSVDCGLHPGDHPGDVARLRQAVADAADTTLPAFLRARLETCFDRYLSGSIDAAYRPAVLHADLSPEHVLFDPDAAVLTGVIDWGDVRIGDPARDFIFLYEDWGPEFLGIALDAYAAREGTLFVKRVYVHYLADQLDWTLAAARDGRGADVEHGVALLSAAALELERSEGR